MSYGKIDFKKQDLAKMRSFSELEARSGFNEGRGKPLPKLPPKVGLVERKR